MSDYIHIIQAQLLIVLYCLDWIFSMNSTKFICFTFCIYLGLYLYANCELMAISGFGRGCDVCTRSHCHQLDQNTHLMFGRPNKGPHFKLTHFSSGDITIYEDFFNTDGVTQLCGSNNGMHDTLTCDYEIFLLSLVKINKIAKGRFMWICLEVFTDSNSKFYGLQ